MLTENTARGDADFDWRTFLLRWSGEWADALPDDEVRDADDEAARRARWLGFPPASEERIAATEKRLGRRMPPSYRSFLLVSDGWRHAGGFVWRLAGTADARWHDNESQLADVFEEFLEEDAEPEERREAGVWRRGLQLDVESDATYVLLDPEDVDEDGEWAVWTWASEARRRPGAVPRLPGVHGGDVPRVPQPPCPPRRRRDAVRQRHDAGAGRPGGAGPTGRPARRLGRRAAGAGRGQGLRQAPPGPGLGDQIRRLLGLTYMVYFPGLVTDPRYAAELLPPLVADHASRSHGDDTVLTHHLRGADEALISRARATLDEVRAGTYRYTAPGPFGEAVDRARALVSPGRHRPGMARPDRRPARVAAPGPGSPGSPRLGGRPAPRPPAHPGAEPRTAVHAQGRATGQEARPGARPRPARSCPAFRPGARLLNRRRRQGSWACHPREDRYGP